MKTTVLITGAITLITLLNLKENKLKFSEKSQVNQTIIDTVLTNSIKRGAVLYEDFCMQCHMAQGEGIKGTFPPLAQADYLLKNRQASISAVKYGLNGKIIVNGTPYNSIMPGLGLYDDEVADVMNFVFNSWGNTGTRVTEEEVKKISK
ncbi:c-type cytochrome [Leeuwenhoekiella sp. MAR_2009_132]|uniref:c-type cytochrome n=1 Tax=Leeuwenhoekiella sp. MAR_2009_132 TaxID=1392489 RepID=UPI0004910C55|nr:cytochrome c [Leeuwenhoekiella sp. MAR_2009_132]